MRHCLRDKLTMCAKCYVSPSKNNGLTSYLTQKSNVYVTDNLKLISRLLLQVSSCMMNNNDQVQRLILGKLFVE
jgi:hypothetical protein